MISLEQLEKSYRNTMSITQSEMSKAKHNFSKFIHYRVIEVMSRVLELLIARPKSILLGSITACISLPVFYIASLFFNFTLSGSEVILAFIFGWFLGIIHDVSKAVIDKIRL